jgi:hypothetical protein
MVRFPCASAFCLLALTIEPLPVAAGLTQPAALQALGEAVELCLLAAIPPTAVHFQRSAAVEPCRQAERDLFAFQMSANRRKNLACSGSLVGLGNDLLLISLHGGTAILAEQALGRINNLKKVCFHVDRF